MSITAQDFAAGRVTNPNQSEIFRQKLFDYQLYPHAGATQLSFFQSPIGQGLTSASGAAVGSAKTRWDTNMSLGGQLPSGMAYRAESIEVMFWPGSVNTANTFTLQTLGLFHATANAAVTARCDDVNTIYSTGELRFRVLTKDILAESPLMAFPPKAWLQADAAIATNAAATAVNGVALAKASGRPYYLDPPVTLQPAVNFEVILAWPAAVALPSGFNGRIGVAFDGCVMRAT